MSGLKAGDNPPEEKREVQAVDTPVEEQGDGPAIEDQEGEEGDFITEDDVAAECEVGDDGDAMMDEDGEEEEEEGERQAVEDTAKATFKGHSDAVYCVAVNPNTVSQLVTGGGDDKAFLWTIRDDGVITASVELSGHTDSVASVAFSTDGSLVATGCYGGVLKVWEAATGALKNVLEGPGDIEWLTWHTLGNVLLTGSQDGTVWMWEAIAGTCMQVFVGHEKKVSCGMFTSSGKAVVTGSDDCTVRVWAPRTGECRHVFTGHGFHEGAVTCLARHPNPAQSPLIMSGGEDGTARVIHVQSKRVLGTMVHCHPGEGSVEAVGFCATHPWVATGATDGGLKVWDSATGSCRHTCTHPAGVTKLEWHPAAPLVFTSCVDGNVRVWDARTGMCEKVLTGHTDMILDLQLVDLRSQEEQQAAARAGATAVAITPAGATIDSPVLIVTASDDHTAKVFRWPEQDNTMTAGAT